MSLKGSSIFGESEDTSLAGSGHGKQSFCKWCDREFGKDQNPRVASREQYPTLQRRKPRSLECVSCVTYLSEHEPLTDRKSLENQIKASKEKKQDLKKNVLAWEEQVNRDDIENPAKRRKGAIAKSLSNRTELSTIETNNLEMRKNLGIFWPEQILKNHKVQYDSSELQSLTLEGRKLKGIVREPYHGEPVGSVNLVNVIAKGVAKNNFLHDSRDSLTANETNEMWSKLRNKPTVVSNADNAADEDGNISYTMKMQNPFKKRARDDDSGDDIWDNVWDAPIGSAARSSVGGAGGGERGTGTGTGTGRKSKGKGKGKAPGDGQSSQRITALQKTEQIVLAAKHAISNFENTCTIHLLGAKTVEKFLKDINGRNTQPLIELYMADADMQTDTHETHRGLGVIHDIKRLISQLSTVLNLAVALHEKIDSQSLKESSNKLYQAAKDAKAVDIKVPMDYLIGLCIEREATKRFEDSDFAELAKMLLMTNCEGSEPEANDPIGETNITFDLKSLLPEQQGQKQMEFMASHLTILLKEDSGVETAKHYLSAMMKDCIKLESWRKEVDMLEQLLYPMRDSTTKETLLKNKRAFENDKSLLLHKAMCFFKGGDCVMIAVDSALMQRSVDLAQKKELEAAKDLIRDIPDLVFDDNDLGKKDTVVGVKRDQDKWRSARTKYEQALRNGSQEFLAQEHEAIEVLKNRFMVNVAALKRGSSKHFEQMICPALQRTIDCMLADAADADAIGNLMASAKEAVDAVAMNGVIDHETLDLSILLPKSDDEYKAYEGLCKDRSNLISALQSVYGPLARRALCLNSDASIAFGEILSAAECKLGFESTDAKTLYIDFVSQSKQCIFSIVSKDLADKTTELASFIKTIMGLNQYSTKFPEFHNLPQCSTHVDVLSTYLADLTSKYAFMCSSSPEITLQDDMKLDMAFILALPSLFNAATSAQKVLESQKCTESNSLIDTYLPKLSYDVKELSAKVPAEGQASMTIFKKLLDDVLRTTAEFICNSTTQELKRLEAECNKEYGKASPLNILENKATGDLSNASLQTELIQITVSAEAKGLYQKNKALKNSLKHIESETFKQAIAPASGSVRGFFDGTSADVTNKSQRYKFHTGILMAVQAIFRPTKPHETRASLCMRALEVSQKIELPPNLKLTLVNLSNGSDANNANNQAA